MNNLKGEPITSTTEPVTPPLLTKSLQPEEAGEVGSGNTEDTKSIQCPDSNIDAIMSDVEGNVNVFKGII